MKNRVPIEPVGSFYYFFYMLVEFLTMSFWYSHCTLPEQRRFSYEIGGVSTSATIYSSGRPHLKRAILFLSGSYNLCYDIYIRKMIADIQTHSDLPETHELLVFEQLDQSSIDIYDGVAAFLRTLELDELILMGFSSGGVVASHIMSRLPPSPMKRKIITYDTPWQIQDNVASFALNTWYRIDRLFYQIVRRIYSGHYNYDAIRQHMGASSIFHGADEMVAMIQAIHGYTPEEMYRVTGWNWDIPDDTTVINIFCAHDPFVNRSTHERYVQQYGTSAKFTVVNIKKDCIGHCSDMGYGTDYLRHVLAAVAL
jgi:pimeloyl-ACP methyl ester carboxylesterase